MLAAVAAGCGGGAHATLDVKGPQLQPLAERCATHVDSRPPAQEPATTRAISSAVDELTREGAHSVFLMGASFGGVTSMVAGSKLGSKIAGVISVSGETRLGPGDLDALAAVPRLRAPFLILASPRKPHRDRLPPEVQLGFRLVV